MGKIRVEFLRAAMVLNQPATPLARAEAQQWYEEWNREEDYAYPHQKAEHLATADYNEALIREGIGCNYENGCLILRHGDTEMSFRGSSVEGWGSEMTPENAAYAISLMENLDSGNGNG